MHFSKPVAEQPGHLHLSVDYSQLVFAQTSKQCFYLSIFKNLTFAPLLRHYFVSLICFFSAWLQNWGRFTVNRPIDQSKWLVRRQTRSKSATRGRRVFGQGGFRSLSPAPSPSFCHSPQTDFGARPRGRRRSQTPRLPGFFRDWTSTNRLKVGYLKAARTKMLRLFSNSFHLWAIKIYLYI